MQEEQHASLSRRHSAKKTGCGPGCMRGNLCGETSSAQHLLQIHMSENIKDVALQLEAEEARISLACVVSIDIL